MKSNGSLWAWGYNDFFQLGNGTTTPHITPVRIGTEANWSAISAGFSHTLALKSEGSLWVWGINSNGALGDGTSTSLNTPVRIGTTWSAISAGDSHTLALNTNGSLWAWGSNGSGQLGDGTYTNRNTPTSIVFPFTMDFTITANKATPAAPDAPTAASVTTNSITLNTISGAEYRLSTGTWQDSPTFTGLSSNTGYTFRARIKETATHSASPESPASAVIFTSKLTQTAPTAPTAANVTANSITLSTISGAEYRLSTGTWQDSPTFAGLSSNTGYTFRARIKETATHYASPESPASAVIYTAVVVTPTYALNVSSGAGGTVSGTASGNYAQGHSVSVTANPSSGYRFVNWTVSGVTITGGNTANPATFTMPANAVTLMANFEPITPTYALNISSDAGGTVSGTASGNYAQGHSVSVTANPYSGYRFVNWTVSGATITEGNTANPATFTMPANAVSLTANFEPIPVVDFVPVTNITGVTSAATAGTPLTLTGTVNPTNATNKTITWSVRDAGMTGATISGNRLNTTAAGYVTVRATIANGLAVGVNFTKDFYITVNAAPEPVLTGVSALAFNTNYWVEYDIENGGDGNFYVTLFDYTDTLNIHGVRYIIENVPSGAVMEYEIEKDGAVTSLNIYRTAAMSDIFTSEDMVTFNNGDRAVYKLWLDDVLIGTFTVVYVNMSNVEPKDVVQAKVDGASYFAPVSLPSPGYGYTYEIVSRPNTVGGTAPRINADGQFVINQQAMPLNISRAGEYVVRAVDGYGNVAYVYIITVY